MELSKKLEAQIAQWNEELKDKNPVGVIGFFLQHFGENIILSTSLGLEDQVITEMVLRQKKNTEVFRYILDMHFWYIRIWTSLCIVLTWSFR